MEHITLQQAVTHAQAMPDYVVTMCLIIAVQAITSMISSPSYELMHPVTILDVINYINIYPFMNILPIDMHSVIAKYMIFDYHYPDLLRWYHNPHLHSPESFLFYNAANYTPALGIQAPWLSGALIDKGLED